MNEQQQSLQELQHIKKMMERSSRFISLSGLSGVGAGVAALIGAWLAYPYVFGLKDNIINDTAVITLAMAEDYRVILYTYLFWIAAGTFLAALLSAFFFTWIKSRKEGKPIPDLIVIDATEKLSASRLKGFFDYDADAAV